YANKTTIFLPALKTPAPDKGNRLLPLTLKLVAVAEKDLVFMPMNINGNHWVCLVMDKTRATIYTYDSFDKRANQNLLAEKAFEVVAVHSPIQKDGHNCGLFVCLYFWRRLCKEAGSDYTNTGLLRSALGSSAHRSGL
ncbi:hypothetical protein JG688_00008771, partial [Phytophthora aleatoria]